MGAQRKQKNNRKNRQKETPTLSAVPSEKNNATAGHAYSDSAPQVPDQAKDFERVLEVVQHAAPEAHDAERRSNADSKGRDRRVIPRVTSPAMRNHFANITYVTRFATGAVAIYLIGLFISALSQGKMAIGKFIFDAVVMTVIAIAVYRFGSAIRSYLNSESQEKLVVVTERTFLMLFLMTVLGTVMGIIHMITLF